MKEQTLTSFLKSNTTKESSQHLETVEALQANAIVLIDEKQGAAFPVLKKQRAFFSIVYQPWFVQVLKVYGYTRLPFMQEVAQTLKQQNSIVSIQIESRWKAVFQDSGYKVIPKTNYTLEGKEQLHLHSHHIRSLKKAAKAEVKIKLGEAQDVQLFLEEHLFDRIPNMREREIRQFEKFTTKLENENRLKVLTAYAGIELCACGVYYLEDDTWVYLKGVANSTGRKNGAMVLLMQQLIEELKDNERLDFAGSEIEGVATFFKRFGATKEQYFQVEYIRYPFLFNLFGKLKGK
jgi:hypothetical protein